MSGIERNAQTGERFVRPGGRQRLRGTPESRNVRFRIGVRRKMQRENLLRLPIDQDLRGVVVDLDQVLGETVGAINVVNEVRELVVGDRALIILEHVPLRFATEDAEVIGGIRRSLKDRQAQKK